MNSLSINQIFLERYKIVKHISTGGFGHVFKALNLFTKNFVAIKVDHSVKQSVIREAIILTSI